MTRPNSVSRARALRRSASCRGRSATTLRRSGRDLASRMTCDVFDTRRPGARFEVRAAAEGKEKIEISGEKDLLSQKKSREISAAVVNAEKKDKEYFALVANAEFLLFEEEHFAEQLREKKRYLREAEIEQDFWILPNPKFVSDNAGAFANVRKPCAALIGTDRVWMNFMKLRLDKVKFVELGKPEDPSVIMKSTGDVPEYTFPENWSAPYKQYTPGWWRVFVPEEAKDVVETPDKDNWTDKTN